MPDPAVQQRIADLAAAAAAMAVPGRSPREHRLNEVARVYDLIEGFPDQASLRVQLIHAAARDEGPIRRFAIRALQEFQVFNGVDEAASRLCAPLLDSPDPAERQFARQTLNLRFWQEEYRPSLPSPEELVLIPLLHGQPPPAGLTLYLFEKFPASSMLRFTGARPSERPIVVHDYDRLDDADRVVSHVLERAGRMSATAQEWRDAKEQLKALAGHREWTVRMYAAVMWGKEPRLRDADLVERLSRDENELVRREVATWNKAAAAPY